MVDTTTPVQTTVPDPITPIQAPAPAPAPIAPVEAVQPAPIVETTAVAPAQGAAPATTVEAPAPSTLLGTEIKPVEPAPGTQPADVVAELNPADAGKNTEGGQSVEPAPPPKYESFQFPEGLQPKEEKVQEFTKFLSQLELDGKADHATVQKVGQDLVNLYIGDVKKAAEGVTEYYKQTWDKQKADWRESVEKDSEYGGNRLQTNLEAVNTFLNTHGGTVEQVAEFRKVMESTGLGNNPAIFKILVNASNAYREGKPLAASRPVLESKSRTQTMYGKP